LIVSLLEQLSLTEVRPAPPAEGQEAEAPSPIPDLILAVEEPELYLHPARSRYLFKIFCEMSARRQRPASSTQVLYVTHSPYFIDIDHFDQVRMCRKIRRSGEDLPGETAIKAFSRASAAATLARLTGGRPENFTAASFAARAAPILTTIVSEGFFAQVAVIVEGESDVAALWQIQKQLNLGWDELGVVLLPVDGKNNIASVAVTFQGFEIPTFLIFDGDLPRARNPATNQLLLRLANQEPVDYPPTSVGRTHGVFEDRVESTIAAELGADYARLRQSACQARSYGDSDEALKNSHVMADLVRRAYSEGRAIPTLERMAIAITDLAQ
jgi:predicted ATP-dependent endonuclease of OLD family